MPDFFDEQLANRLVKAVVPAVELCGGGRKPERSLKKRAVMKRCLTTMCFAALAVSAALAQEKNASPPPPKPAADGPSLEVTMRFIQDKINDLGPANFVVYTNPVGNGEGQIKYEATKVVADPSTCHILYHWKVEKVGTTVVEDRDRGFSLKRNEDISVMPMEQFMKEVVTAEGHTSWSFRVDPPVFALKVRNTNTDKKAAIFFFVFSDEQLAKRVAKAMVHAVELCGGGSKPEPF
jgi:hypothetical protein